MKTHVQVAVIGGGVVGCSVLYHLTKLGWSDVCLIERSELTSGSTWHAAGGFHTLNADPNMAALQGYTIKLYKELEALTGLNCGLHHVGGITLADSPERMDFIKAARAMHRHMGLDTHIISPEEIKKLSPIVNTQGILGALYDPLDGHLDPSGTTHAYAKAAQIQGAEIYLRNPVTDLKQRPDGSWDITTKNGMVHAEHVVNAGGLWARELGEMVGVFLPLHPMEHQYLITDDLPEVFTRDAELPHVMDPAGESYLRQEGKGLVIGIYEQDCDPWALDGTRWDFGHELLDNKLDRISDSLEFAFKRFPCLETAGIKTIVNGPFTFAPDGNPLVGPVPGLQNYWSCCAVMAGFSQGGGVGLSLAEWMVHGEPSRDIFAMDVARYGDFCTKAYTRNKVRENYQKRFSISYPNEELPAGRPLNTTPAYSIWQQQRAVFGQGYGMEHVNYFAPEGEPLLETPSFRRSNAFTAIGNECHAVRTSVGINEVHNFGKYLVKGKGAQAWLDGIMAGKLPALGRITLSPMLSPLGKLMGDFTISHIAHHEYQLTASFGAQDLHMRWFERYLPALNVELKNVSMSRIGFQIAGPKARELLAQCTRFDVSNNAMPFLSVQKIEVGQCDAIVQRVSYTGDLGYEIYVPAEQQVSLYHTLAEAGVAFNLKPFGMRAMMSLRLEKSFGAWMREYKPDYTPMETGLDRFLDYHKQPDYIGKVAALAELVEPPKRRLVSFIVDAIDADVVADEPIWKDGTVVGFVTSGGYAHFSKKSVALGFVPTNMIVDGAAFEIEILGEMRAATLFTKVLFDPQSRCMRS